MTLRRLERRRRERLQVGVCKVAFPSACVRVCLHTCMSVSATSRPQSPPLTLRYLFVQFRCPIGPAASLHPVCRSAPSPSPEGSMRH